MKRFFLFLFSAFFFLQAAAAQTYQVTAEQLQKLEAICQSYKANNQTLQQQLKESREQVQSWKKQYESLQQQALNLKTESAKLKEQLASERTSTQNLNGSLSKSEARNSQLQQENQELLQNQIQQEKIIGKLKAGLVGTTAALTLALAATAVVIFTKFKTGHADR